MTTEKMPRPGARLLSALVLLGAMWAADSAIAANAPARGNEKYPPLFGTKEVRSERMSLFPKWREALERHFDERRLIDAPCTETAFNRCHLKQWSGVLERLRGRSRIDQITEINRYMNRKRYILDPRNYGVLDYWASPGQFLSRNGDCEDYAIAKYLSLRALGFDDRSLRIVVLRDLNLRLAHAVLVVYHGNEILVLDNQVKEVVPARKIHHYRPIYSINEHSWWLHRL